MCITHFVDSANFNAFWQKLKKYSYIFWMSKNAFFGPPQLQNSTKKILMSKFRRYAWYTYKVSLKSEPPYKSYIASQIDKTICKMAKLKLGPHLFRIKVLFWPHYWPLKLLHLNFWSPCRFPMRSTNFGYFFEVPTIELLFKIIMCVWLGT